MADEKARNQDQQRNDDRSKAMGAGATAGYQGQSLGSNPQGEMAGQGGGIQGSGQRQSNPGGYSEGERDQRDDHRDNESSTQGRHESKDE